MSIPSPKPSFLSLLLLLLLLLISNPTSLLASQPHPHQINFKSLNLYPQSLTYDPSAQHFLISSLSHPSVSSLSDAGLLEPFLSNLSLSLSSLTIDSLNRRLLLTIHSPFNALAAYDLKSRRRLFLTPLNDDRDHGSHRPLAQDVAVDFRGNAFVTNSAGNFIWKVDQNGEASVFSRSPQFTMYPVEGDTRYRSIGLNGIAYVSKGYLLVVQSNTGKVFKVSEEDGRANLVLLNEDLIAGVDIAIRRDGVVFVVSPVNDKMWVLKSQDSWAQGVVYDRIDVDSERFPTSVAVGEGDRVYVLYGHANEGMVGKLGRESFSIQEVRSKKEEEEDDHVWVFVLIGLGFAYFMFWRFQMRQLVTKMDKKIN